MKKTIAYAVILVCSCNASQISEVEGSFPSLENSSKIPFIHWELMNDRAENRIGNDAYILVLPPTYKTDSTAAICIRNLRHSADIANGSPDTNRVKFPYIKYAELTDKAGVHRFNTWVFISQRRIPNETAAIEEWMLKTARANLPNGLIVDSTENVATLYKLKWRSPDFK